MNDSTDSDRLRKPTRNALPDPFRGPSLGIYAKSDSAFALNPAPALDSSEKKHPEIDHSSGEILEALAFDPLANRLERFALQSAVRKLLPKSRTCRCLRCRQAHKGSIEVWRSIEHGSAKFVNLQTCASVWICPICAEKISARRSLEVLKAIDHHQALGAQVAFLTLTIPHTRRDDLPTLLAGQTLAIKRFMGSRQSRALFAEIGCIGTIRAWEVTHGRLGLDNGWHPHFHILLFVRAGFHLAELQTRIYALWANACRLAGLPIPSSRYGVTLEDGSRAAEYVTKGFWGLEKEMTRGHIKKAKKGETPFQLLRAYFLDEDKQAGALFRAFALAFHGRRQLVWSKGLKAHFQIEQKTDEELARERDSISELLGSIDLDQWRVICRHELRGDVLELARHGWDAVQRLLQQLPFLSTGETKA